MRKAILLCWLLVGACDPVENGVAVEPDAPLTCEPDQLKCGDECVNPDFDPEHCGGCDPCNLENAVAGCVAGECVVAECNTGFCDADGMPGCEVQPDFQTDVNHCGGCNTRCPTGVCVAGVCSRRMFVSSDLQPADMGGLNGADAICQADAQANGLSGVWKAWLADSANGPANRFTTHGAFIRASDQVLIANSFADLIDGTIENPVLKQANGVTPADTQVWSNVGANGMPKSSTNCSNWTSTSSTILGARGTSNLATAAWSDNNISANCSPNVIAPARIYCVEQ